MPRDFICQKPPRANAEEIAKMTDPAWFAHQAGHPFNKVGRKGDSPSGLHY